MLRNFLASDSFSAKLLLIIELSARMENSERSSSARAICPSIIINLALSMAASRAVCKEALDGVLVALIGSELLLG